jgi:hypothetical protein
MINTLWGPIAKAGVAVIQLASKVATNKVMLIDRCASHRCGINESLRPAEDRRGEIHASLSA